MLITLVRVRPVYGCLELVSWTQDKSTGLKVDFKTWIGLIWVFLFYNITCEALCLYTHYSLKITSENERAVLSTGDQGWWKGVTVLGVFTKHVDRHHYILHTRVLLLMGWQELIWRRGNQTNLRALYLVLRLASEMELYSLYSALHRPLVKRSNNNRRKSQRFISALQGIGCHFGCTITTVKKSIE